MIEAASARDQSKPELAIARAIAALEPVVSADPNLYLAQYTLGAALARKAQYAEAAKHLHKAIELQPDSAWAHYEIGASLLKTGDFKTAIVHLEIATGRLPGFWAAHLALAEAYEHLGRAEDAKKEGGGWGSRSGGWLPSLCFWLSAFRFTAPPPCGDHQYQPLKPLGPPRKPSPPDSQSPDSFASLKTKKRPASRPALNRLVTGVRR